MPFVKGQSGNPGGMPKGCREIARLAQERTPEIIKRLVNIALKSKNERAAIAAAEVVLERGFGKAIQPVDTSASVIDLLAPRDRTDLLNAIEAAAGEARADLSGPPAGTA